MGYGDDVQAFPKIGHLRHVASDLPYFPMLPDIIEFEGTVKLHGTHIAVSQSRCGEVRVLSRNRELSQAQDNSGSWDFVHQRLPVFQRLLDQARALVDPDADTVVLYGELAGRGIQAHVGINQVDRFVALFAVSVDARFATLPADIHDEGNRVFNLQRFEKFRLTMDPRDPLACEHRVIEATDSVGNECPVARALGVGGKGEGIVWRCLDHTSSRLWFKSKAPGFDVRPAKAPVPKAACDIEQFVTPARLQQGLDYLRESGLAETIPNIGAFAKWVAADVLKEEGALLNAAETKAASRAASNKAFAWYRQRVL